RSSLWKPAISAGRNRSRFWRNWSRPRFRISVFKLLQRGREWQASRIGDKKCSELIGIDISGWSVILAHSEGVSGGGTPSEESRTRTIIGRNKVNKPVFLKLLLMLHWHAEGHVRPASRRASDVAFTADFFEPVTHVAQTISGSGFDLAFGRGRQESTPVINDGEHQARTAGIQCNLDLGCPRVLEDIVQRFFEGQKQVVPHLGRQGPGGKIQGHLQAAGNVSPAEKILGELAEVTRQAVQRVMFRIHGPNDL